MINLIYIVIETHRGSVSNVQAFDKEQDANTFCADLDNCGQTDGKGELIDCVDIYTVELKEK